MGVVIYSHRGDNPINYLEATEMKKFRTIYIVEAITEDGELVMRRFARNKKIAEKIARQCKKAESIIRKARKAEHNWINPEDVEG